MQNPLRNKIPSSNRLASEDWVVEDYIVPILGGIFTLTSLVTFQAGSVTLEGISLAESFASLGVIDISLATVLGATSLLATYLIRNPNILQTKKPRLYVLLGTVSLWVISSFAPTLSDYLLSFQVVRVGAVTLSLIGFVFVSGLGANQEAMMK